MRKNSRHSAKELENYINLYLINGKSYRELKDNYGLELNSKNFFGILKSEMYYLNKYDSFESLSKYIDQYIHFFNIKRITLKMELAIPL